MIIYRHTGIDDMNPYYCFKSILYELLSDGTLFKNLLPIEDHDECWNEKIEL